MPTPYIEEFLYRGRCPDAEKGAAATFHVVLAQFGTDPAGKPTLTRTAPLAPEQARLAGYSLSDILGAIANQAVLERDAALAAKAEAEGKIADAEAAKVAALDAAIAAGEYAASADKLRRAAEANLADAVNEAAAKIAEIQAGMEPAESEPEGPKNPALHWITRGLFGN